MELWVASQDDRDTPDTDICVACWGSREDVLREFEEALRARYDEASIADIIPESQIFIIKMEEEFAAKWRPESPQIEDRPELLRELGWDDYGYCCEVCGLYSLGVVGMCNECCTCEECGPPCCSSCGACQHCCRCDNDE